MTDQLLPDSWLGWTAAIHAHLDTPTPAHPGGVSCPGELRQVYRLCTKASQASVLGPRRDGASSGQVRSGLLPLSCNPSPPGPAHPHPHKAELPLCARP